MSHNGHAAKKKPREPQQQQAAILDDRNTRDTQYTTLPLLQKCIRRPSKLALPPKHKPNSHSNNNSTKKKPSVAPPDAMQTGVPVVPTTTTHVKKFSQLKQDCSHSARHLIPGKGSWPPWWCKLPNPPNLSSRMVLCQVLYRLYDRENRQRQASHGMTPTSAASAAIPPAIRLGGKHSSPNHGEV